MGSSDEEDEYVGPHEVARVLRMSPMTVMRWASHGWLSHSITLAGNRRFRREDLQARAEQMKRQRNGGNGARRFDRSEITPDEPGN